MLRAAIGFCSLVALLGCASAPFMDQVMASWRGASLSDVIAQWGYPDQEQTVGGHHLFRWFTSKQFSTPAVASTTIIGNTAFTDVSGGGTITGTCTRTLEVDAANTVIGGQWQGNNCPFSAWPEYTQWPRGPR